MWRSRKGKWRDKGVHNPLRTLSFPYYLTSAWTLKIFRNNDLVFFHKSSAKSPIKITDKNEDKPLYTIHGPCLRLGDWKYGQLVRPSFQGSRLCRSIFNHAFPGSFFSLNRFTAQSRQRSCPCVRTLWGFQYYAARIWQRSLMPGNGTRTQRPQHPDSPKSLKQCNENDTVEGMLVWTSTIRCRVNFQ